MTNLIFFGDVFLSYPIQSKLNITGEFVFNLEGPITKYNHTIEDKVHLRMKDNWIEKSFGKKPIAVCLANNHIMDYGLEGYNDTISELKSSEIKYFGAGKLEENCNNPLIVDIGSNRVGLLGYVCSTTHPIYAKDGMVGVAPIDLALIEKNIMTARTQGAKKIIINLHWGIEEVSLPRPIDIEIAKKIMNLGVDVIIGHHAHCIQPIMLYNKKYIFFGLGNAIFSDLNLQLSLKKNYWTKLRKWNKTSLVVNIDLLSDSVSWQLIAIQKNRLLPIKSSIYSPTLWQDSACCNYNKKFEFYKKFCRFRYAISRFIARPKIPKIRQLLSIFRAINQD